MIITGLIKFTIGLIGLLLTFVYFIVAVANKNKREKFKTAAKVFFSTAAFVIIISVIEFLVYPSNSKSSEIILEAYREAPIGGIWLALYEDKTWELGNSSREVRIKGQYQISGDTLIIIADQENEINADVKRTFVIDRERLIETTKTGIHSLEILTNKINENGL
ncbi:hypothetical protein [Catalinimonas alkaloidigena]|uniref:hypothetical protein n=1 Tax=Catalinimonas alkaloidigena TaxID=1075417 RepID=UPI0024073854|nr:hypothetical protein [Catalinimonas alkaloidigena]